jgi:hypothetical protein
VIIMNPARRLPNEGRMFRGRPDTVLDGTNRGGRAMPHATRTGRTPQRREMLPDRISVSLEGRLQELADRHLAVRSTGAQQMALARKQKSREALT